MSESDLDDEYDACDVLRDSVDRTVVERTGAQGSSLTIESGYLLFGCDKIPDPATAEDPDLPYGGIWCASPNGSMESGTLNDPRLSICPNTEDEHHCLRLGRAEAGREVGCRLRRRQARGLRSSRVAPRARDDDGRHDHRGRVERFLRHRGVRSRTGRKLRRVHARSGGRRVTQGDAGGAAPPAINARLGDGEAAAHLLGSGARKRTSTCPS